MSAFIDTNDMVTRDRAEMWQHAICDQFVPLHVTPTDEHLRGRIAGCSIGDLQLRRIAASPHRFDRSPRLIKQSDQDYYKLVLCAAGTALLAQDGREAVVRAGDMALYDSSRPFTFVMDEFYELVVCMVPKRLLSSAADQLRHATATRIDATTGSPALLAPFLGNLFARSQEFVPGETDALTRSVSSIVDAIVRGRMAPDHLAGNPHFLRALCVIDDRIGDPTLCPESVAAASAVSLSYLHKLFAQHEMSVASHIRDVRLRGCWRDLRSPLFEHLSVAAVGARWGLNDPAQLSRAFKARFGLSPAAHRRAALEQGDGDAGGRPSPEDPPPMDRAPRRDRCSTW